MVSTPLLSQLHAASQPPVPGEEFAEFYARYVARVPDGNVVATLRRQGEETHALLGSLSEEAGAFRYAAGKWSVKEVVGHVADTERVMAYRALRVARGDATPLPGFDQDPWVAAAEFDGRSLDDLRTELAVVRAATVALLAPLDDRAFARRGTASGHPVSVRGLAWIIAGHELHHLEQLRSKYIPSVP